MDQQQEMGKSPENPQKREIGELCLVILRENGDWEKEETEKRGL